MAAAPGASGLKPLPVLQVMLNSDVLQTVFSSFAPPPHQQHSQGEIAYRVQGGVDSTPQGQGGKRQYQEPHLPVGLPVGPSCGQLPGSLDHGQGSMTPGQQALHVARQCIQSSSMHTDAEICQVVRTLAVALGASRPEAGTIKALRAVVMLLERPEMLSEEQACTSTGASFSNFKRWRKRVQSA